MRSVAGMIVVVLAIVACDSDDDRAERNRQAFIEDEAACKAELAGHGQWSSTKLSNRCQRVYEIHERQRQTAQADENRKAAQQAEARAAKESADLDVAAASACDSKARAKRDKWLDTKVTENDYTSSPRDEGFTIEGGCGQKLVHRGPDCSDDMLLRVYRDNPWLVEASRVGFTRVVCHEIAGAQRAVEKPIGSFISEKRK